MYVSGFGEAVEVTQEQLRARCRAMIGDKEQVHIWGALARQYSSMLPRCHNPISLAEHQKAAEAEGLIYESEDCWSFSLRRKGVAKKPVPKLAYTPGVGVHLASETPKAEPAASVVVDPEEVAETLAAEASAYLDGQRKLGFNLTTAEAVAFVVRRKEGKRALETPWTIAEKARQLVTAAAKTGQPISYCAAVGQVMNAR